MGSVVTRDQKLHHKLFRMHAIQGISVSGDDVAQCNVALHLCNYGMRIKPKVH